MRNDIDAVFKKKKGLKLMTHVVAGYPDLRTSMELVALMAEKGADLIEIQIPFSDPLADGPTIVRANHRALRNGIRPKDCFEMVRTLKGEVPVPLILMTYANIPFRMGIDRFAANAAEAGASGVILPDLPFGEKESRELAHFKRLRIHLIPVLSPGMEDRRLQSILKRASGLLYLTLRVGTTGAVTDFDRAGLDFIQHVRKKTELPLAAGFGISSSEQLRILQDKVDAAVIGSHLINVFDAKGLGGVEAFLDECRGLTAPTGA
jgi:tryptophan synthase alpha chain